MTSYAALGAAFGDDAGAVGLLPAIATWCESLQGKGNLNGALREIAASIGAAAAAVTRVDPHDGSSRLVVHDNLARGSLLPPVQRSFAVSVLGPYLKGARAGSIWFNSAVEAEPDPALDELQARRGLRELVVVPLIVTDKSVDFIEFHFAGPLDAGQDARFKQLVETLRKTWTNRRKGLMTEAILHGRSERKASSMLSPILSINNPIGLSRAEYRVCLVLSRGLSNKRVCEELNITDSTIRTHLRNIYAKAQVSDRSELIYRLLLAPSRENPAKSFAA